MMIRAPSTVILSAAASHYYRIRCVPNPFFVCTFSPGLVIMNAVIESAVSMLTNGCLRRQQKQLIELRNRQEKEEVVGAARIFHENLIAGRPSCVLLELLPIRILF